jgi:cephalosporin hydroxylase
MLDYKALVEETFKMHPTLQTPSELEELVQVVSDFRPRRVVELGVYRGGTLLPWVRCSTDDAILVGIDTPGTPEEVNENFQKWLGPGQKGKIILADTKSPATRAEAMAFLGGPIDFLFHDCAHTYSHVRADLENFEPFVRSGGLIILADIDINRPPDVEVQRYFNEIRGNYPTSWISKGTGMGFLRKR